METERHASAADGSAMRVSPTACVEWVVATAAYNQSVETAPRGTHTDTRTGGPARGVSAFCRGVQTVSIQTGYGKYGIIRGNVVDQDPGIHGPNIDCFINMRK